LGRLTELDLKLASDQTRSNDVKETRNAEGGTGAAEHQPRMNTDQHGWEEIGACGRCVPDSVQSVRIEVLENQAPSARGEGSFVRKCPDFFDRLD
jgi:hypothetical protein